MFPIQLAKTSTILVLGRELSRRKCADGRFKLCRTTDTELHWDNIKYGTVVTWKRENPIPFGRMSRKGLEEIQKTVKGILAPPPRAGRAGRAGRAKVTRRRCACGRKCQVPPQLTRTHIPRIPQRKPIRRTTPRKT